MECLVKSEAVLFIDKTKWMFLGSDQQKENQQRKTRKWEYNGRAHDFSLIHQQAISP